MSNPGSEGKREKGEEMGEEKEERRVCCYELLSRRSLPSRGGSDFEGTGEESRRRRRGGEGGMVAPAISGDVSLSFACVLVEGRKTSQDMR